MNMIPRPDPFAAAFAALDPAPAATVLRQLALAALADMFGRAPSPAQIGTQALGDWVAEPSVKGAGVTASLRRLQRAMLFDQITEAAPTSRALVADALPAGRIARLRDRVAGLRQCKRDVVAQPGADAFGPALAALAFGDATFRLSVIAMIRDHLGTRVLFYPDAAPVPFLSAPSCMILIAARIGLADQSAVAKGLRTLAKNLGSTAGWAGFWDQWVLKQAADKATFTLPAAIQTLPLLAHGYGAIGLPAGEVDPMLVPDWLARVPVYCQSLLADLP